jgi:hypothetical protein
VSRTTTVRYGERLFWALDDAFGAWFAYLVEEIDRRPDDPWLAELARDWRVAAAVTDFGATVPECTTDQLGELLDIAAAARRRATAAGDITAEELGAWLIVDDLPVSDGFPRTEGGVLLDRILEVADGFVALLGGTLPPDPPEGAWFFGTGNGDAVIRYRRA